MQKFVVELTSVGNGITDNRLKECLQDTSGLFVDHGRDTLHATSACETANRGLGDTLDVVAQYLPVSLGSALAEALATFAACEACQKMHI